MTEDATARTFGTAQTVKTANSKTETAWHWGVTINGAQYKCHTHTATFLLPPRFIFKGAPNLENLGTKRLAFYTD